jgi:hypothetical protein
VLPNSKYQNAYSMNIRSLRLLSAAAVCAVITCCVKDRNINVSSPLQEQIQEAKNYFETNVANHPSNTSTKNFRALMPRSLDWTNAYMAPLSNCNAVVVPIRYNNVYVTSDISDGKLFSLSDAAKLVIFKDSTNRYHSQVLTFIPDSNMQTAGSQLSGTVFNEDWQGNSVTKPWNLGQQKEGRISGSVEADDTKEVDIMETISVCTTIEGYNYATDDPDNGEYWSETSCTTYGFEIVGGGGLGAGSVGEIYGGGGGGAPSSTTIKVPPPPPTNIIANIKTYMDCFSAGSSDTYTVTLAVEQPVPGTSQPWTLSSTGLGGSSSGNNPVNVGHTFLIFTENPGQWATTRNVGFYPSTMVIPYSPSSPGVLNNDANTGYNIGLTVTVSSSQFFAMLNYMYQANNTNTYNLNSNNCTDFAVDAMAAGGVSIPTTVGSWLGGQGLDPGDLGQDISGMQLSSNMTRSTSGGPHPNAGTCN